MMFRNKIKKPFLIDGVVKKNFYLFVVFRKKCFLPSCKTTLQIDIRYKFFYFKFV